MKEGKKCRSERTGKRRKREGGVGEKGKKE